MRSRMDGRKGWNMVDCGTHKDGSKAQWEGLFAHALTLFLSSIDNLKSLHAGARVLPPTANRSPAYTDA
jgi:hypothetical protein